MPQRLPTAAQYGMPGSPLGGLTAPMAPPVPAVGSRLVAQATPELCVGCGRCVTVCPTQAIFLDDSGKAIVNSALCQGCAACAAQCPVQAIQIIPSALARQR